MSITTSNKTPPLELITSCCLIPHGRGGLPVFGTGGVEVDELISFFPFSFFRLTTTFFHPFNSPLLLDPSSLVFYLVELFVACQYDLCKSFYCPCTSMSAVDTGGS